VEEEETKQLRYSVWPSQKVEVPPVWTYPVHRVKDSFVYDSFETIVDHGRWRGRKLGHSVPVPDELYLREVMALDLADEDALFEFVEEYGPLGYEPEKSCLPYLIPEHFLETLKIGLHYDTEADVLHQPLVSVQAHLRSIRDAVRLYKVQTAQMTLEELDDTWELEALAVGCPTDDPGVDRMLAVIVNQGLMPFQVGIRLAGINAEAYQLGLTAPDIYSCLCLQLFNHIAEEAIYLTCHNEKCGRLFVRQQGRSQKGVHRTTGVMYCSDYCARAQGQRELRKRKAAAKGGRGASK
jgi:hypothetical protein